MAGAFNIDIEVERTQKQQLKIYCASLTDSWDVERSLASVVQFHTAVKADATISKNKIINLPDTLDVNNVKAVEEFLSRLGCLAPVLRLSIFHDLLNIPQSVREGLTYAQSKPFGKVVREGYLQRHLRYVQGGGRKFVRLTKDERGGSLIIFPDDAHLDIIVSSFKIGASTELQNLKDKGIDHAFALRSGKRQWILQAADGRNYAMWQSQLVAMLKEFGTVNLNNDVDDDDAANNSEAAPLLGAGDKSKSVDKRAPVKVTQAQVTAMLKENLEKSELIKKMTLKRKDMKDRIEMYADKEAEMKTAEAELKRKRQKEFQREKEDLIADYEVKQDNLRGEIEELNKNLEQKTFDEGGKSGLKTLFAEDFIEVDINDYRQASDGAIGSNSAIEEEDDDDDAGFGSPAAAQAGGADDDDDESDGLMTAASGRYKYLHKHMHRHDHKHIHNHRHTHIHDQTVTPPITYTHTHTVCHTIAHTTTQFKIKK